jgi:hypothetical protein
MVEMKMELHIISKLRYPSIRLHVVKTQKNTISTLTVVKSSKPIILLNTEEYFKATLIASTWHHVLNFDEEPFLSSNWDSWKSGLSGRKTNSMELKISWEAASRSAAQEFPQHFMVPEGSLPCSQEPSTGPYPEPDQSSQYLPILFLYNPS